MLAQGRMRFQYAVLWAAVAAVPAPVIWWHSEGHAGNTTVLAQGAGLAGARVEICNVASECSGAEVLERHEVSLKFAIPGKQADAGQPWSFRAFEEDGRSSSWHDINRPAPWWVQGDASGSEVASSTPGGWLKVYGRSLGFDAVGRCASPTVTVPGPAKGTRAVLSAASGGADICFDAEIASCFDATFRIPGDAQVGLYRLLLANGLAEDVVDVGINVTLAATRPWPDVLFLVALGESVIEAVAKAGDAGGGVVELARGVHDVGDAQIRLAHNVRLRGPGELRWSKPTSSALISSASSIDPSARYGIEELKISVAAPTQSYVFEVGGRGTRIHRATVSMPHNLSGSASVFHTVGESFEITECNITHDNQDCTSPKYPRDCLLFFDTGTDCGLVARNNFSMGCCAFEGYSASGVLLEDNTFVDLPNAVQPDGNGFASFGKPRVSERISFSRNVYQGMFNGENVRDGSYPHEAFTSDGNGGAFAGNITSATANSVIVGSEVDGDWARACLAVLEGSGQGQMRRIARVAGMQYFVDEPFDVPLDHTSLITIVPYVGRVMMLGNDVRNSTTVQIFGTGFDSVYAGNKLTNMYATKTIHPSGLFVMALDYQGGYQPNLHFEIIGNTLVDTQGLGVIIDGNPANLTLSQFHVVRDNVVVGKVVPPTQYSNIDGAITVGEPGGHFGCDRRCISDVVVENNSVIVLGGNGTCAENGVRIYADRVVQRGTVCQESERILASVI